MQCNGSLVTLFSVDFVSIPSLSLSLSFARTVSHETNFIYSFGGSCVSTLTQNDTRSLWAHIIEMIVGWMKTTFHMENIQCVLFDTIWSYSQYERVISSKEHMNWAKNMRFQYDQSTCILCAPHTCTLTISTNQRHLSYSMNIACDISSNEQGQKKILWIMNAMSKSQSDTNKFNLM